MLIGILQAFAILPESLSLVSDSNLRNARKETHSMARFFPRNEANVERVLRVLVGLGILSLTVIGPRTMWGLIGVVPVLTGLLGSCPLYTLLGFSTCPVERKTT